MYLSHLDAHALSIEELTGERPFRGRSMYIENQQTRTGIIDDTRIRTRPSRSLVAKRPISIHFGNLPKDIMAGNYVSGWEQPRDQHAVGQQIVYSAEQKLQHQQSYPQRSAGGRRPFGRYGSRPSSDSTELVGGAAVFNPKGNRAADMFKRAKEHTDKFAIDDEAITPQAVQKARHGADEYNLPKQKTRPQQQSRPVARPASRPVAQQPAQKPASPAPASFASDFGAPPPSNAQRQQQTQRQQQAQRQQQQPARQPAQQQSPYATNYGQARPATSNGPQYDARTRQQRGQQQPIAACNWNKDNATKRFHAGVQPYEDSYNRSAQGWSSQYKDTFSDDDASYDPFAPKKSPNFQTAPKLQVNKTHSRQTSTTTDFNKRATGWNPIGLDEQEAEALYSTNRPAISTLSSAFEEPRPKYAGGQQKAAPSRQAQQHRPQQQQQQHRPPQQQQRPPQQQQQRRPPQQQTKSSSAPYAAGSGGCWGGMLESDDL